MAVQRIFRWVLGKVCRLPARLSADLMVDNDMVVPMSDGVELLADRYYPRGSESAPVVLMRSPYGRSNMFGMMAKLIAERGFQVVIQSVRGTGGSGGQLNPMRQEEADGGDTLDWVRQQPWFGGQLFTFGGSYLGNVQWAMASAAPDKIDGMALSITLSNFRDEIVSFGGYTQAGTLSWTQTELMMIKPGAKMQRPKPDSLDHAHAHLPVGEIDKVAFDETVPWWQEWTAHEDPEDTWWQAIDHSEAVKTIVAPTSMVGGWQDIFLPFQVRDFEARQAAGLDAWLTIGPWSHISPGNMIEALRDGIALFQALSNKRKVHDDRAKVRVYLQEAKQWLDFPSWPPPGGKDLIYYLRNDELLSTEPASTDEDAVSYTYDPAEPTPSIYGPMVIAGKRSSNMAPLLERTDRVVFTSEALNVDTDVIGPVSAELAVRSNREHTDFYICVCDVNKKGESNHVVDGYIRLRPDKPEADESGVRRITISCWPTAYRFKKGHQVRVIVTSGAHPRYARNLGTGEPLATGTTMMTAEQEILLGAQYQPSIRMQVQNG